MIRGTRRALPIQLRHVAPVRLEAARGLVARVYEQVERDFGMLAPPISLHAPAPEPLAASWLLVRETLLAAGAVDRVTREVVATAVSSGNACPYCVDVHGATLHGLAQGPYAVALIAGRPEAIPDPGVRDLAAWARTTGLRRVAAGRPMPFPAEVAPDVVGVAVAFHYLNRMVNVFLAESPFPPSLPDGARGVVRRVFGRLLAPMARGDKTPGRSLELLPAAPLPVDLSWAAGSPKVAQAFARAAAAVDAAGERSVPDTVRDLVAARLSSWDGEAPGLTRGWLDGAVSGLPAADRPAGRLALLIVEASYRVTEADVADFRTARPDDRSLVELASWASLAAARRVGTWQRGDQPDALPSVAHEPPTETPTVIN
ncbi:carboxymuconolactone decarboxylase family protein [Phytohabitans flavus]